MCCLWTNKQFATNLNCKPNHQWIFLLFSLYFLIKFLWNCLCSTHRYFEMQFSFTSDEIVLQFLGVVRISPWSNSTVTLFCTYQSTDYGRVIRPFFFKISQMVFSNWADSGINCGLIRAHCLDLDLNSTFLPMHENQKIFGPNVFIWCSKQ